MNLKQELRYLLWVYLFLGATACKSDSDCTPLNFCDVGNCKHKDIFPVTWEDCIGAVLVFSVIGLSNASGLGGGVLMVPILITVLFFDSHSAVALSLSIASMGAATAYLTKVTSRRPNSTKPLVDYDIAMLMQPGMILGTVYGVMLNEVCPSWLLLVLLTLILTYMSYKTLQKGIGVFKQETEAKNCAQQKESVPLIDTSTFDTSTSMEPVLPMLKVMSLLTVYSLAVVYALMAGTKESPSIIGVSTCTTTSWLLLLGYSLINLLIIFILGKFASNKVQKDLEKGLISAPGDLFWSTKTVLEITIIGAVAGVAGAMLGVGGGLIIAPVLLRYNVNPQTTAATSIFLVLFSASISAVQYLIAGYLNFDYGLCLIVVGILGSLFGVLGIKWLVDKYRRSSIIIFVLGGCLGVSALVLVVFNGIMIHIQEKDGTFQLGVSSFCH